MTVPANLTLTDIATRVMNQLRLPVSNTVELAKVTAVINEVYRDICAKQDWWWLIKRAVINTRAKIDSGTVSVTKGSAAITFSAAITPEVTGFTFMTPGGTDDAGAVYRVGAHTAGSANATLDATYTNATSTDSSYALHRDAYTLPEDCGKVLNVKRFGYSQPLVRTGLEGMSEWKLYDTTEGKPQAYSVFDYQCIGDPTSQRLLQVHPFPDDTYRLEIFYKQTLNTELAGTTQPFIPDDFRQVLIYGTLARAYPIFLNDVERGKYYGELFNDVLALMSAQQKEYAHDQPGIAPRNDYRPRQGVRARRSWTYGSRFDRWPSEP